ncbi:MAG: DUF1028 domain-containing protein [Oceanospirillaceae bacterium]|jgi:uncharacterized Ntn-hydrolase superfamily protein|nr:DUF1028 domain-containing protein [Oceanospirillaceae bacterium]MBT4442144.1 DUF1028 domain-containing protein [Oceanospirillaceae bacterium]MBT6077921.1 DUF1028 domain-containing protein [Oceanospirillaceae bacterium]
MTFSISGFCERTGMVGVAITTSSISVASRCPWIRAGVGAAATQNVTDPSLGNLMLDGLEQGQTPAEVIDQLVNKREFIEYRQLALIDAQGRSASFTGAQTLGTNAVVKGDGCIAAGNLLITTDVPKAMAGSFSSNAQMHLAERLLVALQAGVDAGGEEGPVHSAGLKVAHIHPWPLVDLRVDWADDGPISQLMDLWKAYEPQMMDYNARAINPSAAPSYGVPGDL